MSGAAFACILALGCGAPPAAADSPLAACEGSFAADRDDWNGCACFFPLARDPATGEEARRRLIELTESAPELPCPFFYLASLRFADGQDPAGAYARAIGLYAGREQWQGEFYARMSLARWHRGRAEFEQALAQMDGAVAAARRLEDRPLADRTELEFISLALSRGDDLIGLEKRLVALQQRLGDGAAEELKLEVADKLARVRFRLGDLDRAQRAFDHLAEQYRERGDSYAEATARLNAAACSLQGFPAPAEQAAARSRLAEALAVAEQAGNLRIQVIALRKLGELEPAREGVELLRRSLEIARRLDEPEVLYASLLAYASRLPKASQVESLLAEAEAVRPADGTASFLAEGWLHRLRTVWRIHPPAQAMVESSAVLDEIERLRLGQTAARAEYFSLWLPAHQWLAGNLYARAAWLHGGTDPPSPIDPKTPAPLPLPVLETSWLDRAFTVTERMRGRILLDTASSAAPPRLVSLEEVRRTLAPDEAVLSFQLSLWRNFYGRFEGGAWLLVVTRDASHLYALPDAQHFDPALRHFGGLFEARNGSEATAARVIADHLLAPALADLPPSVEHLVLVPDGALHRLPFGALPDAEGRPLIERFRLSRVPSATLWHRWRRQARAVERPVAEARAPALVIAAPAAGPEGSSWDPLPGALAEGRRVVRRLGGDSELLSGAEASERRVKAASGERYQVLHFATHALAESRRAGEAGVVLAAGEGDDGLLTPQEISGLPLDGELVVLAACRSGSGRVLYGEGPMSLARSFFQAGARTVVASLWRLRDDEAADLFRDFYRHLGRGESVATALAAAQRERRQGGAPAVAWAGVVVLGDGAVVPFPGGSPGTDGHRLWWWIALGFGMMLIALVRRARRRG
ncbi:MAG: CHAT domain-containing protein [Acidobacteriota bacterium]